MLRTVLVLGLLANTAAAAAPPPADGSGRPNIVLMVSDDLGYGDVACYGHPLVKTPNIDGLAKQGLRLTSYYAASPICSPSRAGLMTGRTPQRVGVHNWIGDGSPVHLRRSEITVATLLRDAGYDTCLSGKWHLNGRFNKPDQPQPNDHGFDYWFATQNNARPTHHNTNNFVRNGKPVGEQKGYSSHIVAEEAIRWLKEKHNRDKPFFLYVSFHEPHEIIDSAPEYLNQYPNVADKSSRERMANITQMDAAVGKILAALDENGYRDNTLTVFTSDNGPATTPAHPSGSAGPLRGVKGNVYEGGIRVPAIFRWPGHSTPGSVSDEPISAVDWLPTLCEIAGCQPPTDRKLDGASLLPVFEGKPIARKQPLYWQFSFGATPKKVALREGDWKLVAGITPMPPRTAASILPGQMEEMKKAELTAFELYNLRNDIGEKKDLSREEPERFADLKAKMQKMYHEVREESPVWPVWAAPARD
jgi:arylsulfatase A